MAEFHLSTFDQNAPRSYLRYALCFASNNDTAAMAANRLQRAAKSLVSEVPMLAGVVTTKDQKKPTSATVTQQQVEEFTATIKYLKGQTQSYQDTCHGGIAPRHIEGIDLTPLANTPEEDLSPSCAIQANFIDGGLVLVIYLHHAVADINGVSTILRLMSEGLPLCKLDHEALEREAIVVSQARARLSDGSGAPAFLSLARDINQRQEQSRQQQHQQIHHVDRDNAVLRATDSDYSRLDAPSNRSAIFTFKLDTLTRTAEMLNSRRALRNPNPTSNLADKITPQEVLIAVLWRAHARARWPSGTTGRDHGARTSVSFPVDLRSILIPPLDMYWMGNAETTAVAHEKITALGTSYSLPALERTASIVHTAAKAQGSDLLARARINLLNSEEGERDWVAAAQLIVHDWTAVPVMEGQILDLGLGLGRPDAIRRIGRGFAGNEVVLLPVNQQIGMWEVQVELEDRWMRSMLGDDLLRAFLWRVVE